MTIPHMYQREGASALERFGGCGIIGDEMGLGKSLQALLYAVRNPDLRPLVIVCPASLKYNWQNECTKHFGLLSQVLEGTKPPKKGLVNPCPILILNYDILPAWLPWLKKIKPKLIVADELHFVKSRGAKRSRALKSLCEGVRHRIGLTGTLLTNRPVELWYPLHIIKPELFPTFWEFAQEFCLPPDAPVLMGNLKEKPINEIQIGDIVVGWDRKGSHQRRLTKAKVLGVVKKTSPLQKVTMENGDEFICTPDHKWLSTGSHQSQYEYVTAKTKGTRLSKTGRPFLATKIVKIMRGTKPKYKKDEDYMQGYIHGFWRGDGCLSRTRIRRYKPLRAINKLLTTKFRGECVCKNTRAIDRIEKYLTYFGIKYYRYFRKTKNPKHADVHTISVFTEKAYDLILQTRKESPAWWAGFLGGIYDAEGSGCEIAQYENVNRSTFKMIENALQFFNIRYSKHKDLKGVCILGGRKGLLNFWNIADPSLRRKLYAYFFSRGGKFNSGGVADCSSPSKVVHIEQLEGEHTVYTLTTETGNYVAYGYGSKNCDIRLKPWGYDFSGAKNLPKLHQILTENVLIRRLKRDVLQQLPPKQRTVLPLPIEDRKQYRKAEEDFIGWLSEQSLTKAKRAKRAEKLVKVSALKQLAGKLKLKAAMEWVDCFLEENDGKIILFGIHKSVIKRLAKRYGKQCVVVDGGVTGRDRQRAVERFQTNPKVRVFIGNIRAAGVGLNLTAAHTVAFVELSWTPGEHVQAEDRCYARLSDLHGATVVYLVAKGTIEERLCKIIQVKSEILDAVLDGGKGGTGVPIWNQLCNELMRAND